jgi:hypothetical protein
MNSFLHLPLKPLCLALALAGLTMASHTGHTQATNDFSATADQDWNNPANWSGGTPTAASVARLPTNEQVDIGGPAQVGTLQVEENGQVVVHTGASLAAGTLLLGTVPAPGAVASLLIDGSVTASRVSVGDAATGGQILRHPE